MPDYSSWKVAELKAELKNRGIPQTGLRLKQHFIDKLVDEDSKAQTAEAPDAESPVPEPELPQEKPSPETAAPNVPQPEPKQALDTQEQEAPQDVEEGSAQHDQQEKAEEVVETQAQKVEEAAQSTEQPKLAQPAAPSDQTLKAPTSQAHEDEKPKVAEPVEQAPERLPTNEPEREESAKPASVSVPSAAHISEPNTGLSTPLPLEEALEDTRKRKRRSQSPAPTPEEIATKKARAKEERPHMVLKENEGSVARDEGAKDYTEGKKATRPAPTKQDARFRDLFAPTETALARPASPTKDSAMEDVDVKPALHAATAALYVDGLMRPLQPAALRSHLVSLATPSGASPNGNVIREFWLDPIKTHSFVSFANAAAASRVRSALHGTMWPNERNRKKLWVDFIPDDKIEEWIRTEEESRDRPGPAPRWEVRYEGTGEGTIAVLGEVGSAPPSAPSRSREAGFNRTPPLGPRRTSTQAGRRPSSAALPVPAAPPTSRPGQGFKPLDELFESTTTKPKLYYLPVPRRIADKRLDQFDELLGKGTFPRRGGDETRRITFEDEGHFVDIGPEYGARAQRRRQGRGGRPGDSWRA